jgi:hypothetical protein
MTSLIASSSENPASLNERNISCACIAATFSGDMVLDRSSFTYMSVTVILGFLATNLRLYLFLVSLIQSEATKSAKAVA